MFFYIIKLMCFKNHKYWIIEYVYVMIFDLEFKIIIKSTVIILLYF